MTYKGWYTMKPKQTKLYEKINIFLYTCMSGLVGVNFERISFQSINIVFVGIGVLVSIERYIFSKIL